MYYWKSTDELSFNGRVFQFALDLFDDVMYKF